MRLRTWMSRQKDLRETKLRLLGFHKLSTGERRIPMKTKSFFRKTVSVFFLFLFPALCHPQESNPNVFGIELGNLWLFQGSYQGLSAGIPNPSLEQGSTGWGPGSTSGTDYTFSISADAYDGVKAASLTVRNDGYAMIGNQTSIPILTTGLYTLSLYAKVSGDVHHLSIAAWKARDPNTFPTTFVGYISPMGFSGAYEHYQLQLNLEAGDYIRLELGIDNNAAGTSYVLFDKLELGDSGGSYTLEKEVVRVDQESFSPDTLVVEERVDGTTYGGWYEVLPGEVKLWGIQDGGSNNPQKFSSGLKSAWFPMAVGDQRVTDATMVIEGYTVNVRMTVNIVAQELVNLGFDSLNAYKARYEFRTWNSELGYDETDTWYYWMVPYIGSIKYQDAESTEEVASFAIGGGTISHQSDADHDGLKDYREILYGTDWLDMDTDGDGLTDGQEDVNANGVVDVGERDPRVKDPAFGPDSPNITHPYSPMAPNTKVIYVGTGTYAGYGRYYQVMGTEVVDSVNCLKVAIKGHGNNSNPDADTEWYTVWLAEDESGVVWVLKHYDALSNKTTELGRANATVWAPTTFAVGQRFGEIEDSYREVVETWVTVNLGTGLGPYTNCVKVKWVEGTDEDFYYLASGVGIVKEEWNDGGNTNGWELQQIITGAMVDELVLNYGVAYGLWHYAQTTGWVQLNTVAPSQMLTVDIDNDGVEELIAAFAGYGLYVYKQGGGWTQINTVLPDVMMKQGKGVAMNFGATYGLWYYDAAGGWQQMNSVPPDQMAAVDMDGDGAEELIATFAGYGLYTYKLGIGWTQIDTVIADAMVRHSNGVVCDYGATYGLWFYSQAGGWVQFNTADPDKIVAVDIDNDGQDELVVSFVGWGLYTYEPVSGIWQEINTVIPGGMIRQGNGIAVDYGAAYGLWSWSQAGGWQQRNTVDPGQMTAVDIDKDGVEELVVSFSGYGLYYFDETNGWQLLNTVLPVDMKPINFYP
jgi:hypothetical protein